MNLRLPTLFVAGLLTLGGCGGGHDATDAETAIAADATTDADYANDQERQDSNDELPPQIALTVERLDPLVRGLTAENSQLEQAVPRLKAAESDGEQLQALADIDSERLDAIGAEAAGLDIHDYRWLRDALDQHLGAIETRVALEAQYGEALTDGMDEATAAEARRVAAEVMATLPDPYADLEPALADALRQRQAELAALRAANIALLFEAYEG
ncbi:hypothetical protein [Arenimonas alkanexedens]